MDRWHAVANVYYAVSAFTVFQRQQAWYDEETTCPQRHRFSIRARAFSFIHILDWRPSNVFYSWALEEASGEVVTIGGDRSGYGLAAAIAILRGRRWWLLWTVLYERRSLQ